MGTVRIHQRWSGCPVGVAGAGRISKMHPPSVFALILGTCAHGVTGDVIRFPLKIGTSPVWAQVAACTFEDRVCSPASALQVREGKPEKFSA